MPADTLSFGGALQQILNTEGMSKAEACKHLGVKDPTLYRLLGDSNSPSIDKVLGVLDKFGYRLAIVKNGAEVPDGSILLHGTRD